MTTVLDLQILRDAMDGAAAAFRCRQKMQPAGGEGDKVFPPTYSGAVYATEMRRLPEREEAIECVLLDSVQSQVNRMEEALQQALDEKRITLPLIEVNFEFYFPGDNQPEDMRLIDPVGTISSLQAPHRIADAILRDSLATHGKDGQPLGEPVPFRKSDIGRDIDRVSLRNATPLFELCPTALLFGMWDSTGPKGGLGAKFERAMVSEVVGIDAVYGVKTSSRIDPLGIQRNAGPLYRRPDGGWTLDPEEAMDETSSGNPTGKKILYKKDSKGKDVAHKPGDDKYADQGRPSEANHGNVTPLLSDRDRQTGEYLAGGVTISHAEQTIVISLPALRRLRFPVNGKYSRERDVAGRTVLAALGLLAGALADEAGLDLRSRCLLYPEQDLTWELLDRTGGDAFMLSAEQAIKLFEEAVEEAKSVGLPWREDPLVLLPSEQLVKLVVKSQQLAAQQGGDTEGVE